MTGEVTGQDLERDLASQAKIASAIHFADATRGRQGFIERSGNRGERSAAASRRSDTVYLPDRWPSAYGLSSERDVPSGWFKQLLYPLIRVSRGK